MITANSSKGKIRQGIAKLMEKLQSRGLSRAADGVLMKWAPNVIERHGGIPEDMQGIVRAAGGWAPTKSPVSAKEFFELYSALKAIEEGKEPEAIPLAGVTICVRAYEKDDDQLQDCKTLDDLGTELSELGMQQEAIEVVKDFPGCVMNGPEALDLLEPYPDGHPVYASVPPGTKVCRPPYKLAIRKYEEMIAWRKKQLEIFAEFYDHHQTLVSMGRGKDVEEAMNQWMQEAISGEFESAKYAKVGQCADGSLRKFCPETIRDRLKAMCEQLH